MDGADEQTNERTNPHLLYINFRNNQQGWDSAPSLSFLVRLDKKTKREGGKKQQHQQGGKNDEGFFLK
jgi:hypothetical protein